MLTTAIFDMDGLLTESESRWRIAEREVCAALELPFTDADFDATMGVRMRQIAHIWFGIHPWDGPTPDEVADSVVDRVIELCANAVPLPGVIETLDACATAGLRIGLCSSSDQRMIDAILNAIGLTDRFEVAHSAEADIHGKPHPEPYLVTAGLMGVEASDCLVFEDSVTGCVAAKAAGMKLVAVPAPGDRGSARFGFADVVLDSLEDFGPWVIDAVNGGVLTPSLARARFHLAFPVTDLAEARRFYGTILGCAEGRSAATWVDFDLYGHQIVAHLDPAHDPAPADNDVDGHAVPASHFGVLLHTAAWDRLVARLVEVDVAFLMPPTIRFEGELGEQRTCFVADPAGNALEFKAFADDRATFAIG